MSEVCHDVQVEPHLQPLSYESLHYKSAVHEDDARVELVLELSTSGAVIIIVLFLMLEYSMLLLTVNFLLVQQQLFKDMRVKNLELTRSMYERWKEAVLLLCVLFSGAWVKLLQLRTYRCLTFLLIFSDK